MLTGEQVRIMCEAEATNKNPWTRNPRLPYIGDKVIVVSGRKVPKGTVCKLLKISKNAYSTEAQLYAGEISEMLSYSFHQYSDGLYQHVCNSCVLLKLESGKTIWSYIQNIRPINENGGSK